MKCKLSLVFFVVTVVLIGHSAAADSAKSREKRSPKPQSGTQLGNFLGVYVPNLNEEGGGQTSCVVHIRRNLPELQPVFINNGAPPTLMVPIHGNLTWAHGETSLIACPSSQDGPSNFISITNSVVETIQCHHGLMFSMNGRLVSISSITCDKKVTGNYRDKPDAQCAGTNKAIGFHVPFGTGAIFLGLFDCCFDDTNGAPLYTHHVLLGNEIEHKCIYRCGRPQFKTAGLTTRFAVSSAYTQANQKARLATLFSVQTGNANAESAADDYFKISFLERGHFTPDADHLFTTWQWSTYFFINIAGMWKVINNGNWKTLEIKIRKVANVKKENFEIYTGTYGTLALCTRRRYCPEFTLENGGIPVPKWWWKIVKVPTEDAAIALVVSNNPFEQDTPICGSQQSNYGWHWNGFDNIQKGKVSYCTVRDLKSVVGYIPQEALATHVLDISSIRTDESLLA